MSPMADLVPEYLENLRALLRSDMKRWRMVVERQVLSQLLPKVSGSRAALESPLWELLILCLDGVEATPPDLTDDGFEAAKQAAADGHAYLGEGPAAFPRAAVGVAMLIAELREVGVYPPPRI